MLPFYQQTDNRIRLFITDSCTLDCVFCPKNRRDWMVEHEDPRLDHRPSEDEIIGRLAGLERFDEVVFSGFGEPTLRLNLLCSVAQQLRAQGKRVILETDGLANLVHRENVLPELAKSVDTLRISMNAHNQTTYEQICRPGLPDAYPSMIRFLDQASGYIEDTQASVVEDIEGVDFDACASIAQTLGVTLYTHQLDHFS